MPQPRWVTGRPIRADARLDLLDNLRVSDTALLFGLAASAVGGFASAVASDELRDQLATLSARLRKRRIAAIRKEWGLIQFLAEHPASAIAHVGGLLLPTFGTLVATAVFGATGLLLAPLHGSSRTAALYEYSAVAGIGLTAVSAYQVARAARFCRMLADPDRALRHRDTELRRFGEDPELPTRPEPSDPAPDTEAAPTSAADGTGEPPSPAAEPATEA
jgi:hypothetical protein